MRATPTPEAMALVNTYEESCGFQNRREFAVAIDELAAKRTAARIVPAGLAIKIMEALHVPPYDGLTIKGEPLRVMLQHRIENLLEVAALIPDVDATRRLRLRLDSILVIITEKEKDGIDIEIGSTAFKSIRRWADWRVDK